MSLFATDPMVHRPTHLDIDQQGRLWVTEPGEPSEALGAANSGIGRIVILAAAERQ